MGSMVGGGGSISIPNENGGCLEIRFQWKKEPLRKGQVG